MPLIIVKLICTFKSKYINSQKPVIYILFINARTNRPDYLLWIVGVIECCCSIFFSSLLFICFSLHLWWQLCDIWQQPTKQMVNNKLYLHLSWEPMWNMAHIANFPNRISPPIIDQLKTDIWIWISSLFHFGIAWKWDEMKIKKNIQVNKMEKKKKMNALIGARFTSIWSAPHAKILNVCRSANHRTGV